MKNTLLLSTLALALLTGCSEPPSSQQTTQAQPSEKSMSSQKTATARVISLYERSCKSCHEVAATGAPLTGDQQAWSERMDKGMDTLLQSAINGSGAMPPLGLCMDCTEQDFINLIQYMSGEAS